MEKKEFVYKTAADIYTAMFTRVDKDPDPDYAIESSEKLWDMLERKFNEDTNNKN